MDVKKQKTRNVIYGVVSSLLTILVLFNIITEADQGTLLEFTEQSVDLIGQLIALATSILAFVKSLTSKVTTVEIPARDMPPIEPREIS